VRGLTNRRTANVDRGYSDGRRARRRDPRCRLGRHNGVDEFEIAEFLAQNGAAPTELIKILFGLGVGTQCPAIGAGGGVDGFPRIARLTTIIADGVHTALGKVPTEDGGLTATGAALTRVGRVPTRAVKT